MVLAAHHGSPSPPPVPGCSLQSPADASRTRALHMRSPTAHCGRVRGVRHSRVGRCHDLPMFHVKQPVTARERKTPRCQAPPRTGPPLHRCVRTTGLHRTVNRHPRSAGGARQRHRNAVATNPRGTALRPIVEGPPRSTAIPLSENPHRVGVLGLCHREQPTRRPAHRPGGGVTEWRRHMGALICPALPGTVGLSPSASVSERRAPGTSAASTVDWRCTRMRRSASTVCSLAVM